jgi:Ca2+-binding RTX toxin-like protein
MGRAGDDVLAGGAGSDLLIGGPGADVFLFDGGLDRIADFATGDTVGLDSALWGGADWSAAQILSTASVSADGVLFDFGGDTLLLEGLTSTDGLAEALFHL